jgi:radical SAM-linked protein
MRIAYSQALPVGTTSAAEYFDLVLEGAVELPEALASLVSSMPGDIAPDAVGYVALKEPSLASWLTRARWQVDISSEGSIAGLLAALERVAAAPTLSYERAGRPRTISLSTTLASWEVLRTSQLEARLELVTRSGDFAGLRPQALVAAAAREAATEVFLRTRRCAQWHDEAGAPLDPLDPSLLLAPAVTGL